VHPAQAEGLDAVALQKIMLHGFLPIPITVCATRKSAIRE